MPNFRQAVRRLRFRGAARDTRAWPEVGAELAARPHVFRAPPFTEELAETIRRISPHLPIAADERSRKAWETAQNANCWGEFDALAPVLAERPRPQRVLEIGPGLGRSAVFLTRQLGWRDVPFDLLEGDGGETHYTILGPRLQQSFCGDLDVLKRTLAYNGAPNCRVIDAHARGNALGELPERYDLVYSFYAVGFHWGLEHFLDDVLARLADGGLAVFTVPDGFHAFEALRALDHRTIDYARACPAGARGRMLLVERGADGDDA